MSRPKERIPIVCKIFEDDNWKRKYLKFALEDTDLIVIKSSRIVDDYLQLWKKHEEEIVDYWKEAYDLRLSQVLVTMQILPNCPGFWYHKEESAWLIDEGYPPEDILLWGVNFDKDENLLKKPYKAVLSSLSTEHIEAIIEGGFVDKNTFYKKVFNKVLDKRKSK